jgi:hypothetical protein
MLLSWVADMKAKGDKLAIERGRDEQESPEEMAVHEKLERLLIASFKYICVAELKQVWASAGRKRGCAACPPRIWPTRRVPAHNLKATEIVLHMCLFALGPLL